MEMEMAADPTTNPFRSERLIYRAPEQPDDEPFFLTIEQDPLAYRNSNARLSKPQGKASARRYLKYVAEDALLGVVICLPPPDGHVNPIPIGCIHLDLLPPHLAHHRHADIGIDITKPYQGQGYGSEAINWVLGWAFRTGGLHRVGIRAFSYNEGAVRLYERLGFKKEGVTRETLWHDGRFWDDVSFGMLESEWQDMQKENVAQWI
jgi:RimJ/RimL family protein N-acetyltransferase